MRPGHNYSGHNQQRRGDDATARALNELLPEQLADRAVLGPQSDHDAVPDEANASADDDEPFVPATSPHPPASSDANQTLHHTHCAVEEGRRPYVEIVTHNTPGVKIGMRSGKSDLWPPIWSIHILYTELMIPAPLRVGFSCACQKSLTLSKASINSDTVIVRLLK